MTLTSNLKVSLKPPHFWSFSEMISFIPSSNRPLHADLRIVPCKSALIARMIEISALVSKLCLIGEYDKSVCKALRNVELLLVLC